MDGALYVSSAQLAHDAEPDDAEKLPAGHGTQADDPDKAAKNPAAHDAQMTELGDDENIPVAQLRQLVAPVLG